MNNKERIIKKLKINIKEIAQDFDVEMFFLFGSFAKGFPRENSDIDIAILFSDQNMTDDECFKRITDITLLFSKDIKPEINLLQLHWDFRKPMLYYNAIILGTPIFIKNQNRYITIKNEAIYQMEDFNIFGTGWQLKVAEKNMEYFNYA